MDDRFNLKIEMTSKPLRMKIPRIKTVLRTKYSRTTKSSPIHKTLWKTWHDNLDDFQPCFVSAEGSGRRM